MGGDRESKARKSKGQIDSEAALATLTKQERLLLRLLSRGCTNKDAAIELGVGVRTVERWRRAITNKLGVGSFIEAAIVNAIAEFKREVG